MDISALVAIISSWMQSHFLITFILGLTLMIFSAEKLVKGIVGASLGFGISAFFITAVFVGFDPENLATGVSSNLNGLSGIALGSILGAVMVPIALAFGITALLADMKFKKVSKEIVIVPTIAVVLFYLLSLDNIISRADGVILLLAFVFVVTYLLKSSKKGLDIKPEGELAESLKEARYLGRFKSVLIMIAAIIGIVLGSQMLVDAATPIIDLLGITDTLFGMTIVAFLISIEELAKQLPAALKGRSDISYGNMTGSLFHFFLLNGGIIAIVHPITLTPEVTSFYFPIVILTTVFTSWVMLKKQVPKWAGVLLIALYIIFVSKGYLY